MGYDRGDSFSFDFEPNGVYLVQNRKENSQHDHIPFDVKGNGNIVFSVQGSTPNGDRLSGKSCPAYLGL